MYLFSKTTQCPFFEARKVAWSANINTVQEYKIEFSIVVSLFSNESEKLLFCLDKNNLIKVNHPSSDWNIRMDLLLIWHTHKSSILLWLDGYYLDKNTHHKVTVGILLTWTILVYQFLGTPFKKGHYVVLRLEHKQRKTV